MKCALCQINEADKKNTHFLTDAIIRRCLNAGGSNEREKGLYYNMSPDTVFTDFGFQRNTPPELLVERIGRAPSEEEIEKNKKIPFSVDFVFCSDCEENIFSKIENKFITDILPKFRNADLSNKDKIIIEDCPTLRLFFLLQVWRTHICVEEFKISETASEEIRSLLLNLNELQLKEYPLSITYLETTENYAFNMTGWYAKKRTNPNAIPNTIFMCDFVIQFYDEKNNNKEFIPLYGINNVDTFKELINFQENSFVVKVISNSQRKEVISNYIKECGYQWLDMYRKVFIEFWKGRYENPPDDVLVQTFMTVFLGYKDKDIPKNQKLSEERFAQCLNDFFKKYDTK